MAGRQAAVLTSIEQLFHSGPVAGLDDGELLERFAARRDEAAFAALVSLHGPMVLGVCRRILRDGHDVEDAFQATFLVLVKRAGSIRDPGRLGPWLHGVARRVAMRARAESLRRRSQQDPSGPPVVAEEPAFRPISRAEGDDVLDIIDEEVARLPSRYRDAVVLCDLEGRSYAEAARRLSCPMGTLQSRLARGRARLRTRLVRRGVAPMAMAAILAESARAVIPEALAEATIRAATAGAVSASAAALAGPVARSLIMSTVKNVACAFLLASIVLGAGLAVRDRLRAEPTGPEPVAIAGQDPPPQPQPQPPRADRTLKLEVVDGTDRSPLAGAAVLVRVTRGQAHTSQGTTDDEGRFPIALSGDTTYFLHVVVAHPGFVPIELRWGGSEIPGAYRLAMQRGATIGGVVRDEQGRPIAGARVFPRSSGPGPGRPAMYASMGEEIAAAVTDAEGRWRSEALPATAGPGVWLDVEFTHPDHFAVESRMTAVEARKLSSVQVMKAGEAVAGTVLSPTGRPVAGASVVLSGRAGSGSSVRLVTDEQGRFRTGRFVAPDRPEVTLTVQADGFASAIRRITVTPGTPPQVIKMAPRKPMRGRVVDSQGRPIPGVAVASTDGLGTGALAWEAETDADGRFVWFEAPATGTVSLDAYKVPFKQAMGRRFEAGSEDATITLHRPQHLHGTVTDAETGRPVERFSLVIGWGPDLPGGRVEWLHGNPNNKTFTNGRYDIPDGLFPDQGLHRSIRIEADGYLPGEFLGFLDNVEDIAHDFKLRKAAPLTGIIRGPDGRPIAGADVALSNSDNDVRIENGRLVANRVVGEALHTKTDIEGRFRFQPQEKPVWIVAAHDAGFTARSPEELAASTDVTLAPWGRIEGVLKIGTGPAAGQKAAAWLLDQGFSGRVDYDATADGSGRFVFERVTPGRMTVYRYVDAANHRSWTASHPVNVDVRPGETVRVQVGGTGRPVVGRLAIPEGAALADFVLGYGGHLATGRIGPPTPDDYPDWTEERRSAWWDAFLKTPEGRAYLEHRERDYAVALRPDGTFRVEDVPAGRYILTLPFEGRTEGDRAGRRAFARAEVVVPEMPGGRGDQPLDIGAVPLDVFPIRELNVGDRAPTITSKAADGRPLDLAALRGKFVLLAFWATYHDQTLASIPHLKATYDAFGSDPRLVIIGLNEDVLPETMRRYAARHGLAWEQRYLGSGDYPNPIASAFGVRYPAAVFLIGPDGRIIAKDLKGDAIKQAVARALVAQPPPQPQQGAAEPPRTDRTLKLEVVDATDHSPMPGASVWVRASRGRAYISQGTTDEQGHSTIAVPAGATAFLQVFVVHPGFAPIELRWAGEEPIPENSVVALERGVPIGGTVRDEQGRPIAGARVLLQVGAAPPGGGRERYPEAESDVAAAITDDQGRWRSEALPASARPDVRLELVTTHSDHVGLKRSVTAAELRAFAVAGVMATGRALGGTVLSPTGRPVAGATVVVQPRSDRKTVRRIVTDRDGRFRTGPFIDPEWGEFTMVVQADGFARFAQLLLVPAEIPSQVIRLAPRKPLHGRIVDGQGRPVPGANVRSATEFGFAGLDWEAETDADGRFVWYEAPATGDYMINVTRPPFRPIVARMVPGGTEDLTLTLHRKQRVHGTVTDAETGRPIERFDLISGQGPHRPGWTPHWMRDSPRSFGGGKFDLTGPNIEQDGYHSIRIEADGYEPAEFLRFHQSLEDVAHDFKLRKAAMLAGIVRGPDGRPMAGVDVTLSGAGFDSPIHNGRLMPEGENAAPRIRTGPDGRYAFRPQGHRVAIIAIHDAGFAVRSADDLAASGDLTLAPWGQVEGLVKIGDQPASGEPVAGWLRTSSASAGIHYESRALASGRFVLDRVAPGRLTIHRRVENQDKTGWTPSDTVSLDVKPGETVRLRIGGTGRPVVGRLAIPEGIKLSHFALGFGALAPVLGEPPTPVDFLVFDSKHRSDWWEAFARTPEGRAYVEDRDRSYAVALRPDGTFRIEDVPAGRYVLKLPFEGLSRGTNEGRQAFARSEVVVPEIPGARVDEPLDIGMIPLQVFPFHKPNVGDRAPVIAAKAPDGRPLDLAAMRGKFVLLHFWSGRPEDAATIPHLKATHDAFGRDPRFVMIGLIADETPGPVRRYAARHGLGWEHRFIGSTYDPNPFEAAFGIWFPPAAFLIGPDGRILAKDLEGEAIKQAVAGALKPQPPPQPQEGAAEPHRADRKLELEVVDAADNTPLAGASVWSCAYRGQEQISQGTTDGEGRHAIPMSGRPARYVEVVVAHPGFVPAAMSWWESGLIPDRLTVAMERGVAIGGTVRDEQGRPIAGARVHLLGERAPGGGRSAFPRPESEVAAAVTDDQGRWRSEALPTSAGPGDKLKLLTTHPDRIALTQSVTVDALRAIAPVAVLRAGRAVSGTVTSPTGRPVAGATVVVLNRHGAGEFQRLRTDAGGRFRTGRFIDPSWDELRLSVQADGVASAMWRLANTPEIPSQAVRLSPRKPMRGRVVDAQGRPIPGASVLPSREYFNGDLDWEAETDADGRFEWFEAPASGTILLDVAKPSFRTILARPVAGGSGEVVLTLHRPQHLHGTATDAETGRPIGRFALIPGDGPHLPGWAVDWKSGQASIFTDGRFDLPGDLSADRGEPRSIRIEADGYEPAESLGFPGDAEDVVRDIKLRKDTRRKVALSGIVHGPDGRPIADAEVALGDDRSGIRIEDGHLAGQDVSASHRTRTDRKGRYAFPLSTGDPWIAVVHDSGFAMRSPGQLAASTEITLAPWGRIEGVLRFGSKPAPGQGIRAVLSNSRFPGFVDANVQTDREGRFVFERVTPGRLMVYRPVRHHDSGHTPSHKIDVDVAAGQSARIQLGGTGRPVVGRLALPEGAAMNHFLNGPTRLHSEPPPMPIPPDSPRLTDEQWTAWRDALIRTPQWEMYFEGEHQYAVAFRPDGTFRIEDVPAGRYILEMPFRGNAGGDQPARRAYVKADVVVPEMAGGRSDEPLDIGVIPLDVFPIRELNVGDRIPLIKASDSDGRPLDLAALRGKFVLLAFWATSHVATRANIPHLKATHDAFGRDPRLVMIGLNQDIAPELMRRYAAHRGIAWEQRHISGWGDTNPIASAFGVRYPAAVFLIGPDGRILAKDLQGDGIQQAVVRALGQAR